MITFIQLLLFYNNVSYHPLAINDLIIVLNFDGGGGGLIIMMTLKSTQVSVIMYPRVPQMGLANKVACLYIKRVHTLSIDQRNN